MAVHVAAAGAAKTAEAGMKIAEAAAHAAQKAAQTGAAAVQGAAQAAGRMGAGMAQTAGQAAGNPYAMPRQPAENPYAVPDELANVPGAPNRNRANPRATGWQFLEEEAEKGSPIVDKKMLNRLKNFEGAIKEQAGEAVQDHRQKDEQKQKEEQGGLRQAAGGMLHSVQSMNHPMIG